ncbi:TetR/AcrR family transcriptional regulator [Mycolicibacterium sp. 3033]|nr:TetR/AcrR family transcriptional regulator [Mycolicibacterium aurantiacum]
MGPTAVKAAQIRDVAMKCFARRGIAATSLRTIAEEAGVSLGLVQHYFVTKDQLIEAIDQHVLDVFAQMQTVPSPAPEDLMGDASDRLGTLMTENPDVMDYVGRALAEHGGVGDTIFDGFFAISAEQGAAFAAQGLTPEDLDPLWSNMLPLILRVGTIMLRHHIERHTDGPLYEPGQMSRWNAAVTRMICRGQMT